ncbi:MAG: HNH endonuclease [Myxococcaceae bacterium]|nr:HNH endonuclease [Myxococcaceae bacterium]
MTAKALLLAVARTDATFEPVLVDGRRALRGRCLHCNRPLVLLDDGTPVSAITLEHIVPKTAGGTDDLGNLGLACPRCNHGKGVRHDRRLRTSARSAEVIERLLERRRARWREAP